MQRRRLAGAILAGVLVLAGPLSISKASAAETLTVFAAASLKNALDAIDKDFAAERKVEVKASYAASGALAKQIEQGAPADIFISADQQWMDYVAGKSLVDQATRADLLANGLVLVATRDFKIDHVNIAKGFDPTALLDGGRLAMGQPDSVPAGKYGKTALENLDAWPKVQDHLAFADNVRSALALVARGEAPLGIVYATDAVAEKGVKVVGTFPADSHPPIVYPVAILADSKNPAARDYLAYLHGTKARAAFEAQGFTVLDAKPN